MRRTLCSLEKTYQTVIAMLTAYQQQTIKTLKKQGKTLSEIARAVSCHRNTARAIVEREEIVLKQEKQIVSSFSSYQDRIKAYVDKGFTKIRIWQQLKDDHKVETSYSALCKYIEAHISRTPQNAYIVQTAAPGEEAEVDFGYAGLISLPNGKKIKVWFFVMTLGYSRLGFYMPVFDQSVATFIDCHKKAFAYFGGVPQAIKLDNLKAAILTNRKFELEFQPEFLSFAAHYSFIIKPCTPYRPNQKGKVESGVGYVKKNFLPGRTFTDPQDFDRQLTTWMHTVANRRIHGTTKQLPIDLFTNQEKQHLQQLPLEPFAFFAPLRRKVKLNCHVQYEENYYSVPSQYVGELVEVRRKDDTIEISAQSTNEVIASHPRSPHKGTYVTNTSHFPENKIYSQTMYQTKYEEKMQAIGEHAHLFFKHSIANDHVWVKPIRAILGLAQEYGNEKVDKAIKRAIAYGAYKPSIVKRICENNLEDLEYEPSLLQNSLPAGKHEKAPQLRETTTIEQTNENHGKELLEGKQEENEDPAEHMEEETIPDDSLARDLNYYTTMLVKTD